MIKSRVWLILSGLVIVLASLLGISGSRIKRLKERNRQLRQEVNHRQRVMESDVKIEEQSRSRRADAIKEIKDTGDSELFRDPNRLRRPRD